MYDTIDAISANLRPPPFTDGTVNESVRDVFVRVTQLMSILETQYFNETIVIVAPDSDNLSVLEAGLTGLDLRRYYLKSLSLFVTIAHKKKKIHYLLYVILL